MLEVTYTTSADGLMALNMYLVKRSPSQRRRLVIGWVMAPALVLSTAALMNTANAPPGIVLGVVVGGLLLAVAYPVIYFLAIRLQLRGQIKERAGPFGRTTLALTDEGVRVRSPAAETAARWETMKEAVEDGDHTYIFLTGLAAVIIPRRGFERAEDYEAVRDFALAKLGPKS